MVFLCGVNFASAQQSDSIRISLKNRTKKTSKVSDIKANIQPYKPFYFSAAGTNLFGTPTTSTKAPAGNISKDKLLTVLKIYPNPVEDQLNVSLNIGKDGTLTTIKIIDLLGNEVVTLANERLNAGEQTKNFTIPSRLNPGIYFLRIVAGGESQVKRISVL